jgi:energy-converting hydrogenase Eha subunit F
MIFKTLLAFMLAIGALAPIAQDSAQLQNEPIPHCFPCKD